MLRDQRDYHFIVPLGGDLVDQGEELGPDTIFGLEEAVLFGKKLKSYGLRPTYLLSPGFPPNKKDQPRQVVSMARMMEMYLINNCNMNPSDIVLLERKWGTEGEIRAAFHHVWGEALQSGHTRHFYIVTRWYHVPRTWVICKRFFQNFQIIGTRGGNWWFAMFEIFKLPAEILRLRKPRDQLVAWWRNRAKR